MSMDRSRRRFVQAAGLAALVGSTGCSRARTNRPGEGPRWGVVIDLQRCMGCHACSIACKAEQDVPLGHFKSWVAVSQKGRYPNVRRQFLRVMCNHCDAPPCVEGCPTGATFQRPDGIVAQDSSKCIGCAYCVQACPYGVRYTDPRTRTAEKCDLCLHRIEQGLAPACVATCNGRALVFGDLNDPASEVSRLIATHPVQTLRPEAGTEPRVYYIGLDGSAADPEVGRPVIERPQQGGGIRWTGA